MAQTPGEALDAGRTKAALWFGMLAGPAAWFLHLAVSYSLVRYVCLGGPRWLLDAMTLVALLFAGAGVWVAWRSWRGVGEPTTTAGGGAVGRTRFMAVAGLVLSGYFLLVILLAGVPNLVLRPCG